jgi:acyl-coenzyme A synthetase/AMP-(fatty) acid ligase
MDRARSAADVGVPDLFNAATYFVDRHVREGRGASIAIECGDERVTHDALLDLVNRFGSALRDRLEVRPEERVVLLLLDTPAFAVAFFGAIKIGAVPIPTNTLWKPPDYRYVLNDSRARVAVVSEALLPQLERLTRADVPALRHIVVVGRTSSSAAHESFEHLVERGTAALDADPTHRDAPAFWLYSSCILYT